MRPPIFLSLSKIQGGMCSNLIVIILIRTRHSTIVYTIWSFIFGDCPKLCIPNFDRMRFNVYAYSIQYSRFILGNSVLLAPVLIGSSGSMNINASVAEDKAERIDLDEEITYCVYGLKYKPLKSSKICPSTAQMFRKTEIHPVNRRHSREMEIGWELLSAPSALNP